jgi:predicted DNA-binding protein
MAAAKDGININIEIKNLPEETNRILNVLAKISGSNKTTVIRAALIDYAENNKAKIMQFVGDMKDVANNI